MENKKTCLYDKHVELGALIQPFGGFDMPIQYSSIIDEHNAVRKSCGIFDVSHMGEIYISGKDAEKYVNHIFTNDVTGANIHQIFYGMMLYPNGGTVDDLLVYKIGENEFFAVINAANINKDFDWMLNNSEGYDVTIDNRSDYYAQIAIQGPKAENVITSVLKIPCKDIPFYTSNTIKINDENIIISRTGYTGEDGFEIYGSHNFIRKQWDTLIESKKCQPCGLGCRDTLRFEVGLPLYGHELSQEITPLMAGLGMFCKLDKEDFIGKEALIQQKQIGIKKKVVGIELEGKAIPRNGYPVIKDGKEIGIVTTGYHCISIDKSVCMALIDFDFSKLGNTMEIQIRKKSFPGIVVKKRFYDKHYKKD